MSMAVFLTPDSVINAEIGGIPLRINVKITPDGARAPKYVASYVQKGDLVKPNAKIGGNGIPRGITVHNTGDITFSKGTNAAEQYARATYPNLNMRGACVHYWVWHDVIWQQLEDTEQGWHATDGASRRASHRTGQLIGGNLDTIAIECIGADQQSEDTTAALVAYLCKKYRLDPDYDVYQHHYFYARKNCPIYIIPHWMSFISKIKKLYNSTSSVSASQASTAQKNTVTASTVYRIQTGLINTLTTARATEKKLKADGFAALVIPVDGAYRVQCGASTNKQASEDLAARINSRGYNVSVVSV